MAKYNRLVSEYSSFGYFQVSVGVDEEEAEILSDVFRLRFL